MSIDPQQSNRSKTGCFGICINSEHSNYDFCKQQNSQNMMSKDEARKKKELDDSFTSAFNQLTFEERQRSQEALHGVDERIAEESTFINSSLHELDNYLMTYKRGSAYEAAERLDPAYVRATAFRVMFLRANDYDARTSASQMISFFEVKRKLFGVEKMVKDITLEDLDDDDRASLSSGWLQLHGKDRSGRLVYIQYPGLRAFKDLKNELRGKFYFMMRLLQSEETQLKGVVCVLYGVEEFKDRTNETGFVENVQLSLAIPNYNAGIHNCFSDAREYALYSIAIKIMPAKLVARIRLHCGSHLEIQYRLCSFGISRLQLNAINLDPQMHEAYRSSTMSIVIESNPNDVLYTGNRTSNNPGNHYLRNLVVELWQEYDDGSNDAKRAIVDDLVEKIRNKGGRFLRNTSELQPYWVESPMEEVRTKIAQMFRNQKRALKRASSLQQNTIDGTPISGNPLTYDVVFGKAQNTPGKEFLQHLMRARSEEYDALDRGRKATVVIDVMEAIKGKGGRFLQPAPEDDGFLEVSDDKARERISKYFRNHRRAQKR